MTGQYPEKGTLSMQNLGYYNGKIGTLDELTVPFNDRVHFFGDGVYEATFTRNHKVFALEEHIDRFYRSAAMVDIKIPMEKAEMATLIRDLVSKVDDPEQQVYFQITRGTQPRNHTYPEDMVGNFWVVLKPMPIKDIGMEVKAILREDIRFHQCHIKTLNLLPAVLYSQEAARAGVYETILYRTPGQSGCGGELVGGMATGVAMATRVAMPTRVTECAHSNVHIINQKGEFQTAPLDNLILPGIARAHLITACHALGIPVNETPFTVDELMNAKEVLISSSSAPGLRCVEIDGKPVGGQAPEMVAALQKWVKDEIFAATERD